ncbi:MAG TPA: hypothetical protein VNO31_18860 [Umezawaea sp.]|nr:hypothetical protein [Umezawaea sp.]
MADRNNVELCLTPTNASWVNPIEAQFGSLRTFTMSNSHHTVLTRVNEPASAANANNAGDAHEQPDQPGEPTWSATSPVFRTWARVT